ncbi:MAG: hypothetical protein A2268_14970 [Candidatus Raymondbacteria bacterium RifOxyA12_full_50_37]|nr:MAG: hypothetical protein A2268_14970 [Candidatus Raymondbacteria bacterium RifOxyA12_full_50_37]OGJ88538.1 MAG: hypothetical protein A2248_20290 [Candidatus Raymondbacteria bacterium RIFOXYA2_FULL_49_16]OGJ98999.1 MAG: hypothetical protein A2453_11010 [Candidatus Raymondbacteria bacterium RIFOXYC2_FULL_50_21]OGK00635.1 MAG: hypothetical protein A2487_13855 [Candidatus Raymondbacteria bacterium RifOxyC12_full_50_8]OGP41509.1 MAG: hypothetical protein A2324_05820 [Candidatus Raymondbacteria b
MVSPYFRGSILKTPSPLIAKSQSATSFTIRYLNNRFVLLVFYMNVRQLVPLFIEKIKRNYDSIKH